MSIPRQPTPEAAEVRERFRLMRAAPPGSDQRRELRESLATQHLGLVRAVALRFRDRGESVDDLVQVGSVGLLKAIDRFDPEHGAAFSSFALPTISGEIKRHFRDHTWAVRVPRRLQELRLALTSRTEDLRQQLGRSPTVAELAADLSVGSEDVLEALEAADAYTAVPLDAPIDTDGATAADRLGGLDLGLLRVEDREALAPVLDALPDRERQVLHLRFVENRTQSEIATEVGVSQMHVSRILARTLATLRQALVQPA
jgi:RNA polymerase sigma-B factor